jgi:hypothetical protein
MLTRNPKADQASTDLKRPARKRARAETAAATVLKRIRQQKAAARKAAASYHAKQRRFWKREMDRAISPQANWRDVGQELRKIWRRQIQTCDCHFCPVHQECYWCLVYQDTHRQRAYYWIRLVGNALHGSPSSLLKLLKHLRRGLTPVDCILLADALAIIIPEAIVLNRFGAQRIARRQETNFGYFARAIMRFPSRTRESPHFRASTRAIVKPFLVGAHGLLELHATGSRLKTGTQ